MVQRARSTNRRNFQGRESEERERLHGIRKEEFDLIFHKLGPVGGEFALDVGCGDGYQACLLTTKFEDVVAVDIAMAEACQKLDALSDARALPFANASFDVVFLSNVLEHVGNRQKVVKECLRVLKGGGTLVISVPSALWKLTEIRDYYLNILFAVVGSSDQPDGEELVVNEKERPRGISRGLLRFFLPPIHGEYQGNLEELFAYRVSSWNMIFRDSGIRPSITIRMPLYPSRRWDLPRFRRALGRLGFSSSDSFIFRSQLAK